MPAIERHFTVNELSKLWGLSVDTVRGLFRNHPGVLKIAHPERRERRRYCTLRIPESVAQQVHQTLAGVRA